MEEIWKDIKNYEGLYQVSTLGNVKSLNFKHTGKEKILKLTKNSSGYLNVGLCKDGKRKGFLVHRLVAETFIPNPDNLKQVNHLSERKTENNVKNLEWVTAKYNVNYGTARERQRKTVSIALTNNPKTSTQIKCFDLQTKEITYYPSIREASRQFNVHSTSIYHSLYDCNKPYKNRYIFTEIKEIEN